MNIAFVASSLPISYFLNHDCDDVRIYCAAEIYESYKHIQVLKSASVSRLAGNRVIRFCQMLVLSICARKVIVFHECAWVSLDSILIFIKNKKIVLRPMVSLVSFTRLSTSKNQSLRNWWTHHREKPFIKRCIATLISTQLIRVFDCYENHADGGKNVYRVFKLKERFTNSWSVYPPYLESEEFLPIMSLRSSKCHEISHRSDKRAALFVGGEPVAAVVQRAVVKSLVSSLVGYGYTVMIKNHPRAASRLELGHDVESPAITYLDASLPAELLSGSVDLVVAAFSTSLITVRGADASISYGKLLGMSAGIFESRLAHLSKLTGFNNVIFIESLKDFDDLLMKRKIRLGNEISE